jgi:hypothetical protein
VAIPMGWSLSGFKGVIWALALSEAAPLVVIWIGMIKHRLFSLATEMRSLVFVGAGLLLGSGILYFWR